MSVTLPTGGIASATPRFIDRGAILDAVFNGPDQRLDRLGSRWGVDFQLVPMKVDDARVWIARLIRGRREKALIRFPQPGFVPDLLASSAFRIEATAANANALNVYMANATQVGKKFLEGQFVAVTLAGVYYIYQVTEDATLVAGNNVAGTAGAIVTVPVQPSVRTTLPVNTALITVPADVLIEGYVKGDQASWTIDNAKIYGLEFTIEESK